jgi:hypothetical protein
MKDIPKVFSMLMLVVGLSQYWRQQLAVTWLGIINSACIFLSECAWES